jgi:plasmid maintenance system killer protein
MIVSSRLKGLERFYRTRNARGIQTAHDVKLIRILAALDAAIGPEELILLATGFTP